MISRLEQLCLEKGLKMTEQRRVIARVLSESADHPDVEQVYRRAAEIDSRISIATVYRTVRLFEEASIIARHDFGDGRSRYEEMPSPHHDHLIDLQSGRVIEFRNEDIDAAQALRYRIFYERLGAQPLPEMACRRRDIDQFDNDCDHLLVVDHSRGTGCVVGTYRLIRRDTAARLGGFYSAKEFDISSVVLHAGEVLELGRSCVDPAYRNRSAMQLLWSGIAAYVFHYDVVLMFGCASLP